MIMCMCVYVCVHAVLCGCGVCMLCVYTRVCVCMHVVCVRIVCKYVHVVCVRIVCKYAHGCAIDW